MQKGVLYMHPIVQLLSGITSFISKLLNWTFLSYKSNDRKVLLPNFKVVGQIQAELYSLKVQCVYKTPFRKSDHKCYWTNKLWLSILQNQIATGTYCWMMEKSYHQIFQGCSQLQANHRSLSWMWNVNKISSKIWLQMLPSVYS